MFPLFAGDPMKPTPGHPGVPGPHFENHWFRCSIFLRDRSALPKAEHHHPCVQTQTCIQNSQSHLQHLTHLSPRAADGESSLLLSAVAEVCSETFLC